MAVNSACLTGNLTKDAVLRLTRSQVPVLNFTLAVNNRRRGENGDWEDDPSFFPCVIYGTRAEKLAQHLVKGTKMTVSGHLRQVTYLKDGESRAYFEVIVEELEFMSRRNEAADGAPQTNAAYQPELYGEDVAF